MNLFDRSSPSYQEDYCPFNKPEAETEPEAPPQKATILSFAADKQTVNKGDPITFSWRVGPAEDILGVAFDGEGVGIEDHRERKATSTREYVLTLARKDRSQETRSITIQVNATEPSLSSHVDRNPINQGECTRVSWDVDNIEAIYFDGQPVGGHDSREVCPTATRDYGLDVRWGGGRQTLQLVNIQVIAQSDKPNIRWWVDRNPINQGKCTRVWWEVDNVSAVYFDGQGVAGHDSREVCPASTRDYGLDVRWGNGNQTLQLVNIQVNPAQPSAGYVKMVEPLRFELVSQNSSVTIRATFKVRNTGGSDVTIEELAAGARKGTDWNGEWFDFPHVYGITLGPGQEYVYDQMRSFDQPGHYFAEPVMKLAGASWGGIDGANRIPFDVQ